MNKHPNPNPKTKTRFCDSEMVSLLLILVLLSLTTRTGNADSALWNVSPATGDWNTAANWTPNTVPNGRRDIATFDTSNTTDVSLSAATKIGRVIFNAGASEFTITPNPLITFTLSGAGITNNSAITQRFATTVDESGHTSHFVFMAHATAGDATIFTNAAGFGIFGSSGSQVFIDNSSAGSATFINNPGEFGGFDFFFDSSTAASATFVNTGGGTGLEFDNTATAADAVITNNGGDRNNTTGGAAIFSGSSSAGNATITNNGGQVRLASGGATVFTGNSTADNSTLIANSGSDGNMGALIAFVENSTGGTPSVQLFGNATLDISTRDYPGITIGSLEGDGRVHLGPNNLTTGANLISTAFSGVIDGRGSLTKEGPTVFTLSNANAYRGGTVINQGSLIVSNAVGSATGKGPVGVNKGTLGGDGIIAGSVTIGMGRGPGAFLNPGVGNEVATLIIQGSLTIKDDGVYNDKVNTTDVTADEVMANGVTVLTGAQFHLTAASNQQLPLGRVFTAISNTASSPISGTFTNFPDGSILAVGRNNYQANYEGGDGNDLTLTVVQ